MFICTFKYTPETVDCKLCTEYAHHKCTVKGSCPYLAERIEAGVVDYSEVIRDTFKRPSTVLRWRLRQLVEEFNDNLWESERHRKRFYRMWDEMGIRRKRDTPQFFAALYLLTANEDIWRRAYNAFCISGIKPSNIRMCGISIPNYALAQAAKSLYLNTDHFVISDLEDSEAITPDAFRIIVNAILIARYGRDVFKIKGVNQ